MTEVQMTVRQTENVTLEIEERITSYSEMISVVKAYVNELLDSLEIGNGNVLFCPELPETGSENVLYVETTTPQTYIWNAETGSYTPIGSGSSGSISADDLEDLTADDEDIESALDETFGESAVASDEDIEAALNEVFGS